MTPEDWGGVLIGAELGTVGAMLRLIWLQWRDEEAIEKMVSEFD